MIAHMETTCAACGKTIIRGQGIAWNPYLKRYTHGDAECARKETRAVPWRKQPQPKQEFS